jgi:hypothetical protein
MKKQQAKSQKLTNVWIDEGEKVASYSMLSELLDQGSPNLPLMATKRRSKKVGAAKEQ